MGARRAREVRTQCCIRGDVLQRNLAEVQVVRFRGNAQRAAASATNTVADAAARRTSPKKLSGGAAQQPLFGRKHGGGRALQISARLPERQLCPPLRLRP